MDTTTAVPRPLRRDAELNRQRITAAAREVFAERGLEATLDDVARHAGLGVGTVYRRFPNKEALVDALFEESFGRVVALTEQAIENPDAWAGLVGLMLELAELQAGDRGLRDLMLSETYGRDRVAQMRDRIKPLMDRMVERAVGQGSVRADLCAGDIPVLQLMISATISFTEPVRPEVWRRYATILLDGVCQRRDQPTPLTESVLDDDELHLVMHGWPRDRRAAHPDEGCAEDKRGTQA
jgi:AcrR family transcriptional regulator